MEFKDRVKARRLELGMTLDEVAKIVGVSNATISRWESGAIENQRRDKIEALAKALKMAPGELMGWAGRDTNSPLPDNIIPMPRMRKIPLLGTIACGEPILAAENVDEEIDIPEHIKADFALRCKGDSMIGADIRDGDIVYIRQQEEVQDGQIAAVLIEDEATLKRFYYNRESGVVSLLAENPSIAPMVYQGESLNHIKVLGLAVGLTRSL